MPRASARRVARKIIALALTGTIVVVAVIVITAKRHAVVAPMCQVVAPSGHYGLTLDQAENAATIGAVGKADGLPDHAVTVALAAALQESELHNLNGGDRDSVGLLCS